MKATGRIGLLLLVASSLHAALLHFEGILDPAVNSNLTFWDQSANAWAPPVTGPTDDDRAFNIAVHTFVVSSPGTVTFTSLGYGLGGFDSVVSVFSGTGLTAAYLMHMSNPGVPGDFSFGVVLPAGLHTLTVGMFSNEPCAPGICPPVNGNFGDGFTNLVNFDPTRPNPLFYSVDIDTPTEPVPEPAYLFWTGVGIVVIGSVRFHKHRKPV